MIRLLMPLVFLIFSFYNGLVRSAVNDDPSAMGMVTGPTTGTQIQFGRNIAAIAKTAGLNILVKESDGSLENIRRMDSAENAALGIVYADALYYLSRSDESEMRRVANRLRLVFPLYSAEAHLLARRSIHSIGDLENKRVVAGAAGSGTWLTTMNLLQLTGVKPAEVLNMAPDDAVAAVLKGEVDAMFFVVGKPVALFSNIGKLVDKPELARLKESVHFVPIDDSRLLREYSSGTIGPNDYSWLTADVPTVAVKAVLMTFDFSGGQTPYHVQRCGQLAKLGEAIRANIDQLRQSGHAKWKEVNLDAEITIWKKDTCSNAVPVATKVKIKPEMNIDRELKRRLLGR